MKDFSNSGFQSQKQGTFATPNVTKPVWNDQQMTCSSCQFNGQDIDTFPCAKCHTRS